LSSKIDDCLLQEIVGSKSLLTPYLQKVALPTYLLPVASATG